MGKVTLVTPVKREGTDPVAAVEVRKPSVGDLRGLKLTDVLPTMTVYVAASESLTPLKSMVRERSTSTGSPCSTSDSSTCDTSAQVPVDPTSRVVAVAPSVAPLV
jgi:hypothetical protein